MNRTNVWLFIASLFIAVLLYVQIVPVRESEREREFTVPIEYRNLAPTLAILDFPETLVVLATGTLEDLDRFETTQVRAVVDLEKARIGRSAHPIQLSAPAVAGVRVTPRFQDMTLVVEERETRTLPVILETTGVLSNLFQLKGAVASPDQVRLSGPSSLVSQVQTARVTFDLTTATPGAIDKLPIQVLDLNGRPIPNLTLEPGEATVRATIDAAPASKPVVVNLRTTGSVPVNFEIEALILNPTTVQITGEPSRIGAFTVLDTLPLNLATVTASGERTVNLAVPNGIKASPAAVTVNIRLKRRGQ